MKKKKSELSRIKSLIQCDRLSTSDSFYGLVQNDLSKLMNDYFDVSSAPSMDILKAGDKLSITIKFSASRIKSFVSVPDM